MSIERSTGIPVRAGGVTYGMAGGGWSGITAELAQVVQRAAVALAAAYGKDVEIRFNSDRESGCAFPCTRTAGNSDAGVFADLVTARPWERWGRSARRYKASASGVGYLTPAQREAARDLAALDRRALADHPEGRLTRAAHIRGNSVRGAQRAAELAQLDGFGTKWGTTDVKRAAVTTAPLGPVDAAPARCLRFVLAGTAR